MLIYRDVPVIKDELLKFLIPCGARGAINVAILYHQGVNNLWDMQSNHNSLRRIKFCKLIAKKSCSNGDVEVFFCPVTYVHF